MSLYPGNKFVLEAYDGTSNENVGAFRGYVTYDTTKDVTHSEYILIVGSKNISDALVCQYLNAKKTTILRSDNNNRFYYWTVMKALLPGSTTSDGTEPKSGDYLVFRGQGGEYNPLLYGTTEYNNSTKWLIYDDRDSGQALQSPEINTDLFYTFGSVDFGTPELNLVNKTIYGGAHGRKINPPQLRFGTLGSASSLVFKFVKVD